MQIIVEHQIIVDHRPPFKSQEPQITFDGDDPRLAKPLKTINSSQKKLARNFFIMVVYCKGQHKEVLNISIVKLSWAFNPHQ